MLKHSILKRGMMITITYIFLFLTSGRLMILLTNDITRMKLLISRGKDETVWSKHVEIKLKASMSDENFLVSLN